MKGIISNPSFRYWYENMVFCGAKRQNFWFFQSTMILIFSQFFWEDQDQRSRSSKWSRSLTRSDHEKKNDLYSWTDQITIKIRSRFLNRSDHCTKNDLIHAKDQDHLNDLWSFRSKIMIFSNLWSYLKQELLSIVLKCTYCEGSSDSEWQTALPISQ